MTAGVNDAINVHATPNIIQIASAQDGDRRCYEQLLREVTPFIRALARRHCRNAADIEEMVQETLLTLHRIRHTYDPSRPFSPWLAAIASRRIIDTVRKRSRVSRHEMPDTDSETFAVAATNNDVELVRSEQEVTELLATLPVHRYLPHIRPRKRAEGGTTEPVS